MKSKIEQLLFPNSINNAVVKIILTDRRLEISVAPWEQLESVVIAEFTEATLLSMATFFDPHNRLNLPWGIIDFDWCRGEKTENGNSLFTALESRFPLIRTGATLSQRPR